MKKIWIRLGLGFLVLFLALQFLPVQPPLGMNANEIKTEESVKKIFRRACYDCHSDIVRWPWYSKIFPVSLYIAHHVEEGREELNFSEWESLKPSKKSDKAEDILDEITEGNMPPKDYLLMHPDAKIDPEELETLKDWLQTFGTGE
ncbi:heme-binding protein [Leptospira wolffii]|uniref:heme-binding domain-containing protein n=1 Tax=Leptospira wolffii TaxID=409998 RepID=UPI0002F6461C|nr:heme-binding domain-containing protein [Leptospira wolffii]EPG67274.1 heme-binding domain protein [Leptospira wolffii serovar Khorat str. Khorat-H2]TGK56879.1 heme-binding protein [Leptospira wolffii]TGK71539.1 heme-binding protein [Leptospira wolffii]TGK75605.1 heme-binding protein [Leptospira wolffii]TGL32906.1 heme-binding protein [Leptospira wolffii]